MSDYGEIYSCSWSIKEQGRGRVRGHPRGKPGREGTLHKLPGSLLLQILQEMEPQPQTLGSRSGGQEEEIWNRGSVPGWEIGGVFLKAILQACQENKMWVDADEYY